MKGSASNRHFVYRERRARGALVVKIELNPARIARLIHRGYIAPDAAGDRAAIARGIEEFIDEGPGLARELSPTPQPARSARGKSARPPVVGAATSDAIPHPLQPPQEAAGRTDEPPPWESDEPLARPPAALSRRVVSTASGNLYWPTDGEISAAYGRAALFVQALRDWQRRAWWRDRAGLEINDRAPIPEDFLPPAEALRMRAIGDPLEALRRRRAGL